MAFTYKQLTCKKVFCLLEKLTIVVLLSSILGLDNQLLNNHQAINYQKERDINQGEEKNAVTFDVETPPPPNPPKNEIVLPGA